MAIQAERCFLSDRLLERDAGELRAFLAGPASPDPVRAMLLAQRFYAGTGRAHRRRRGRGRR